MKEGADFPSSDHWSPIISLTIFRALLFSWVFRAATIGLDSTTSDIPSSIICICPTSNKVCTRKDSPFFQWWSQHCSDPSIHLVEDRHIHLVRSDANQFYMGHLKLQLTNPCSPAVFGSRSGVTGSPAGQTSFSREPLTQMRGADPQVMPKHISERMKVLMGITLIFS